MQKGSGRGLKADRHVALANASISWERLQCWVNRTDCVSKGVAVWSAGLASGHAAVSAPLSKRCNSAGSPPIVPQTSCMARSADGSRGSCRYGATRWLRMKSKTGRTCGTPKKVRGNRLHNSTGAQWHNGLWAVYRDTVFTF